MDKEIQYISYFDVFSKYKVRIIVGTILAFVLMFVWCTFGIPPMKKKWKSTVGLVYPLQKSSLAIKRTLGSLDIPLGGLGGMLGGSSTAYNNIPVLESRRVLVNAIKQVNGAKESLDEDGIMDDADLAKALKKRMKLDDSKDGYLEIQIFWDNSQMAADMANAIVKEMRVVLEELNRENAHFMSEFLKARIALIEQRLSKADDEVRKYKEESKVLAVEDQAVEMIKTYSQLQIDYTQAEMDFVEAATRSKLMNNEKDDLARFIKENVPQKDIFDLAQIKEDKVITLYENGVAMEKVTAAEALKDDGIAKIRKDISDLTLELDHKRLLFTEDHPDIIALEKRIYDAKRSLYQELDNYTRSATLSLDIEKLAFEAKRDVIASTVADLEKKIGSYPEAEANLIRLIRDQKAYEEIYTLLVQEHEQALLAEDRPETTFQVLDEAVPIKRPARPRKMPYSLGFAIVAFAVLLTHSFYLEKKRLTGKNEG